jgi:ribosome maturation factor RimP
MVSSQDVLEKISNLAEGMLKSMGMELVEAQYRREKGGFVLRLFIDRLPEFNGPSSGSGVTLDDCVEVSRQFGRLLDVEDIIPGSYNLEVSSPGLDRPLTRPEHFTRFAGRDVKVRATFEEGRRKIKGRLLGLTDGQVMLESGNEILTVPWDRIERVQLIPDVQWSRKD